MRRRAILVAATALAMGSSCKGGKGGKGGKGSASAGGGRRGGRGGGEGGPSFPVEVYPVEAKKIAYNVTAPGTVEAFERVQVTARVQGGVDKVAFVEGQTVKKGDVLVVIDSERYRLGVNAANAALAKAKAMQEDAEAMVARREKASAEHPGLIPGEEISTLKTKVLTAKADKDLAVENVLTAQLNLKESSVRAPMDGVIQTRTVETGQYVNAGYVMATLLQSEPMLLRFQIRPLEAPRLKPGMVAQFRLRETDRVFTAKVKLVAASADPATRLVPVTAEVDKTENEYWLRPGTFADVTILVGGAREVIVIPREAVRPTERGFVAYVVTDDVAHEKVLTLGMNTADGFVEVREGLTVGDRLVLRGTEPLSEGAKVRVTDAEVPQTKAVDPQPSTSASSGP